MQQLVALVLFLVGDLLAIARDRANTSDKFLTSAGQPDKGAQKSVVQNNSFDLFCFAN